MAKGKPHVSFFGNYNYEFIRNTRGSYKRFPTEQTVIDYFSNERCGMSKSNALIIVLDGNIYKINSK